MSSVDVNLLSEGEESSMSEREEVVTNDEEDNQDSPSSAVGLVATMPVIESDEETLEFYQERNKQSMSLAQRKEVDAICNYDSLNYAQREEVSQVFGTDYGAKKPAASARQGYETEINLSGEARRWQKRKRTPGMEALVSTSNEKVCAS